MQHSGGVDHTFCMQPCPCATRLESILQPKCIYYRDSNGLELLRILRTMAMVMAFWMIFLGQVYARLTTNEQRVFHI